MALPTVVRRWAYVGALVGAGVSIAANVLHSYVPPDGIHATAWQPATGAVVGAVFWPVALLIVVELFARWHPVELRFKALRWMGLVPVAVVAAVVSYRHMSGLLAWWHEDPVTALIGPLAVDGIMVMAAGALIATSPGDPAPAVEPQVTAPSPVPAEEDRTAEPPADPVAVDAEVPPLTLIKEHRRALSSAGTGQPIRVGGNATPRVSVDAIRRARVAEPDATQKQIAAATQVSLRTVARHWQVTTPSMNGARHDP